MFLTAMAGIGEDSDRRRELRGVLLLPLVVEGDAVVGFVIKAVFPADQ
jgi:hypothetical protein